MATRWCTWCRNGEVTTVPKYDEMLSHEDKLSSNKTTRPEEQRYCMIRRVRVVIPGRRESAACGSIFTTR